MELEHSLHFMKGDMFNSTAELLINPVNTVGVMGAGLAEKFKKKYPQNFKAYTAYCKTVSTFKEYRYHVHKEKGKTIFNFATKEHFANFSKLSYIRRSMIMLVNYLEKNPVKSIAIPPVGCGLGGLEMRNVLHLILYYLRQLPYSIRVEFYQFKIKPLVREHIAKQYDLSYRSMDAYTGVGSREMLKERSYPARDVARTLSDIGYTLITGDAAEGGDAIFWEYGDGSKRCRFGPVGRFSYQDDVRVIEKEDPAYMLAYRIAEYTHPAWRWLPDWMKELHTRNVFQVLGSRTADPTEFMVCWTPDGAERGSETSKKTGGTGTAIRIADAFGVPVFNLQREDAIPRLEEFLDIKIRRVFSSSGVCSDGDPYDYSNFHDSVSFRLWPRQPKGGSSN